MSTQVATSIQYWPPHSSMAVEATHWLSTLLCTGWEQALEPLHLCSCISTQQSRSSWLEIRKRKSKRSANQSNFVQFRMTRHVHTKANLKVPKPTNRNGKYSFLPLAAAVSLFCEPRLWICSHNTLPSF